MQLGGGVLRFHLLASRIPLGGVGGDWCRTGKEVVGPSPCRLATRWVSVCEWPPARLMALAACVVVEAQDPRSRAPPGARYRSPFRGRPRGVGTPDTKGTKADICRRGHTRLFQSSFLRLFSRLSRPAGAGRPPGLAAAAKLAAKAAINVVVSALIIIIGCLGLNDGMW